MLEVMENPPNFTDFFEHKSEKGRGTGMRAVEDII
jgi:hypothetical protein